MSNSIQGRDMSSQPGGTAMGGPSGEDDGVSFTSPYSANIHTHANVNEFSKDDHSIDVKHTDVFPPPVPMPFGKAMAPGMGPFEETHKRDYPVTVIGGPSGDDEGQEFNMPITGNFETDVNEFNKDDHSVKVKDTEINPPPCPHPPSSHPPSSHPPFSHPPNVVVPPPGPAIGDMGPGFRESLPKRWMPEVPGTVIGGPGSGRFSDDFPAPVVPGGTVIGGPSGEDDGIDFDNGMHIHTHANVNEYSHDDHSIDLKHTDIYPPPPPMPFGPPFKRDWEPATVMGGPSGDDGGQEFNMPITVDTHTNIHESYEDNHSMDLKHTDVFAPPPMPPMGGPGSFMPEGGAPPFRRAYAPESPERDMPGATVIGGPSGEDGGIDFENPNSVDVNSNVNEHHEDNHAIKAESTDVHLPPHMPWMPNHPPSIPEGPPSAPPMEHSAPPMEHSAPPMEHHPSPPPMEQEQKPACAPEVHEVVHTVTKVQTHMVTQTPKDHIVQATETVYVTPPSHMGPTSAIPMSMPSKRPMTSSIAYSKIPVNVPSPSSSMSMAVPSGADAMSSMASKSASASATPSQGVMFTGSAARLSGGIASAAAAVMGVLAFVL